ncbi:MAG: TatD family hydrolase, partial [Porphyromonas pasteri]
MTEQLAPYIDLHTHHVRSTSETIELLSCYLSEVGKLPSHDSLYYSIGLHPWRAEELREESLPLLREALQLPRVIALGEAGLDKATKLTTLAEQLPI